MEPLVDFFETGAADVGVDLRRRDVRVTEHELHGAEICSMLEQVSRERVAQGVGSNVFGDTSFSRIRSDTFPEGLACQPPARAPWKEERGISLGDQGRPTAGKILSDPRESRRPHGDHPLLPPLSQATNEPDRGVEGA